MKQENGMRELVEYSISVIEDLLSTTTMDLVVLTKYEQTKQKKKAALRYIENAKTMLKKK